MKLRQTIFLLITILVLAGCSAQPGTQPAPSDTPFTPPAPVTDTPMLVATSTPTELPTETLTPTPVPTVGPLNLVFYGDSLLKVGDNDQAGQTGFSIVDIIRSMVGPADQIIVSHHGGRNAKWGFENLDQNVLADKPDVVTLWWGMNDLNGCPGVFDVDTNKINTGKLDAMLNLHEMYMTFQVNALLSAGAKVIIITPMPVLGPLPWTHLDENNQLVWELDHRCDFNQALAQLVDDQRNLVAGFQAKNKPVSLVDVWQIYADHPNTADMYMDILHPGSQAARLIAENWVAVFQSLQK